MKFKPERYFEHLKMTGKIALTPEDAAQISQAQYDAFLQSCPVVYGSPENHLWTEGKFAPGVYTHSARLVQIEELAKKDCKHEPNKMTSVYDSPNDPKFGKCRYCGVEVVEVSVWKAK